MAEGKVRATVTALVSARRLGFDSNALFAEVAGLDRAEFYKSMTTYANHKVWQDVYRHKSAAGMLYVKLTVLDDVIVVSFKELEHAVPFLRTRTCPRRPCRVVRL